MSNYLLGNYILGNSVVHKLNPVCKILSLIIMIISIFFIDSYIDILMLSLYLILSILYSDIKVSVYIKNLRSIRVFLLFVLIIDIIFYRGINIIIFDLFKLIFIVLYASILTYTTAMTEITYGISTILKPFSKLIPVNDIAMIITLTLRYIPLLSIEANRIIKAQKLRGINFNTKNIKEKIISISGILVPMFAISLSKAELTADIMDLRLYNYGKSRSNYRYNKWKMKDSFLLVINILILIIVIFY